MNFILGFTTSGILQVDPYNLGLKAWEESDQKHGNIFPDL